LRAWHEGGQEKYRKGVHMMKKYDTLVIGPVSLDHNIDHLGNERKEVGGAIIASGFAAANSGNRTALFTKFNPADVKVEEAFRGCEADLFLEAFQRNHLHPKYLFHSG
jgi:hypothetical protein